jgi:DNA-binding ferritin-like protein (Dps family)
MNTIRPCILALVAALVFLSPAVRSEQPQKASRLTQEDRIKKLEERADAAEQAADSAAMERDYIARIQKLYESYYQKAFNTQMWTLGIIGLTLTGVFVLVARFSLKMIDERAKTAADAVSVQIRNEFSRALAKEVQKLWDCNATDIKKLKEDLAAQIAKLDQDLKDKSDFEMEFVQGLAAGVDGREGDSVVSFHNALSAYRSSKPRKLIETRAGATIVWHIFESLRKTHEENYTEEARQELANPLYNSLYEELALAALQSPWLTPLINERRPAIPEPSASEPAAEVRPAATVPEALPGETDLAVGEEADSCRLISS